MNFWNQLLSSAKASLSSTRFLLIVTGININILFDILTGNAIYEGKFLEGGLSLLGAAVSFFGVVAGLKGFQSTQENKSGNNIEVASQAIKNDEEK